MCRGSLRRATDQLFVVQGARCQCRCDARLPGVLNQRLRGKENASLPVVHRKSIAFKGALIQNSESSRAGAIITTNMFARSTQTQIRRWPRESMK